MFNQHLEPAHAEKMSATANEAAAEISSRIINEFPSEFRNLILKTIKSRLQDKNEMDLNEIKSNADYLAKCMGELANI